jgi:hypothetical protein
VCCIPLLSFIKIKETRRPKKVHSTKLLAVGNPEEDDIYLRVLPTIDGRYGVFANRV